MVLFILFPGQGFSGKNWEKYEDESTQKIKNTIFLKQLKKMGKVYTFTPNINSIIKLDSPKEIRKIFYKKPFYLPRKFKTLVFIIYNILNNIYTY